MLPTDLTTGFLRDPDNLAHLTLVDADAVREFVAAINAQTPATIGDRKLVAAIGTGGTIAMKIEDGIRIPELDFNHILQQAGGMLTERFQMIGLDAFRIDSSQMDYRHIRDLAIVMCHVWAQCKDKLAGFLILHGTDTMAYNAAALSLLTGQGLPFSAVFTGAQKSILEPMNDAATNLQHSLFTLEALHNADMAEIVVVMGNHAMIGTSAVKVNDTLVNAFDSPMHKYVTTFEALEYPVRLAPWLKPRRQQPFQPTIWARAQFSHTLIVNSSLGLNPDMVARQVEDPNVRAVLLFSYGAGTVYEGTTEAIMEVARSRNIPVFVVSPVNAEYKIAYESSQHLVQEGVIPLYMTMPTALAKIEIALRKYLGNTAAISRFMTENYVGEIPGETSRFSPILER